MLLTSLPPKNHILKCVNTLYSVAGDNESVLLLLLIPRLSFKTELLHSQLRQKVRQAIDRLVKFVQFIQILFL